MLSLAICSIFLWAEGIRRLLPYLSGMAVIEKVDGEVMSIIAAIGVVVNIALALVLGVENHVVCQSVNFIYFGLHSMILF